MCGWVCVGYVPSEGLSVWSGGEAGCVVGCVVGYEVGCVAGCVCWVEGLGVWLGG